MCLNGGLMTILALVNKIPIHDAIYTVFGVAWLNQPEFY